MRYLSLFSGMEAAHLAWGPLGWECAGVAEIDSAACALLRHRLPHVPNLGSVTAITGAQIQALGQLDVVIGGSPCQDLSVAGKRAGLVGARSSLFHEQLRIFHAARTLCGARWLVWENVPGAFSSNYGRDFAVVVGALAGSELAVPQDGWGNEGVALGPRGLVEWSVLDAQWFGVAQRRRRVFAVLDTGDWAGRPPVLLEPDRLRGDSAPRREAGQSAAGTIAGGARRSGGYSVDDIPLTQAFGGNNTSGPIEVGTALNACASASGRMDFESETFVVDPVPFDTTQITSKANGSNPRPGDPCHPLCAGAHAPAVAFSHQGGGVQTTLGYDPASGTAPTLSVGQVPAIAFAQNQRDEVRQMEVAGALAAEPGMKQTTYLQHGMQVRRLTPTECERLQGAPDDWTLVPNAAGKPMADGPRYKMLGNSFAVPVIRWIGERIERAQTWTQASEAAA
ncbi:DNA cytosine methyltransferase [Xanthomonas translucens]|uniref:DNA cytosine methyltransferase n=1 Tax=Xanthomonas campestris pv. translucens TaxID=343 RepID=UPI00083A4836|nr:DNA cytosine methyltransferase [Xanthomonas translucens]QEN93624.1 DNA cytosine methyltransferase [Xanthomonas translucens pv. undulosa]QSQ58062.1 DNA cytosine methyltransferase [Xanthomonas translucens pv. undulosa]